MRPHTLLITAGLILIAGGIAEHFFDSPVRETANVEPVIESIEHVEEIDTWPLFVEALIWVESRGNEKIVGANNDGGVLQITPIYIAEANGIIGRRAYYTLEDRFDRDKSIEIFNVVNAYHNPDKDFRKATRLHNPGADSTYHAAVMRKYEELFTNHQRNGR